MKKGVPNVTAHLSLFLSLLLPFIRGILHHTDNHDFSEILNQTWFLSYLIVPLWYNNVNWDNDNTK